MKKLNRENLIEELQNSNKGEEISILLVANITQKVGYMEKITDMFGVRYKLCRNDDKYMFYDLDTFIDYIMEQYSHPFIKKYSYIEK